MKKDPGFWIYVVVCFVGLGILLYLTKDLYQNDKEMSHYKSEMFRLENQADALARDAHRAIEKQALIDAFKEGAKWAKKHPNSPIPDSVPCHFNGTRWVFGSRLGLNF